MKIYNIKKSDLKEVLKIAKFKVEDNYILEIEEDGNLSFLGTKKNWVERELELLEESGGFCECESGYKKMYDLLMGYIGKDYQFYNWLFNEFTANTYNDFIELSDFEEDQFIHFEFGLSEEDINFYEDQILEFLKTCDKKNTHFGDLENSF